MSDSGQQRVRRLPPGPHGLPTELVERNQRERLIAAMAEVCGERGYAECSVAEVARRAGVSTATFYGQFQDKRECVLVAFEELFARLLEALDGVCKGEGDARDRARAGASIAANVLTADPLAGRLLAVEILAVGPEGVRAHHGAIERLAERLRGGENAPTPDAVWACAAAMVAATARRLAANEPPDASELQALAALL